MIRKIKLTNFRKFVDLELNIEKDIVVLHGDNAKGKSTILEAISLITNGKSPWANNDEYLLNTQPDDNKYTRITIQTEEKELTFFKDSSKRVFKIDNHNTTPKKFFNESASTIFNPEQIEILMISSTKRRDFIDDAISTIDYSYTEITREFQKVLKQRNAYLKKLSKKFYDHGIIARNDPQLNFWTKEFVKLAKDIQSRRTLLANDICFESLRMEYIPANKDTDLEESIENSKKRDIATGYTNIGPHRDDWELVNGKSIKKFGSRGEKRLAIGNMIFRIQEIIKAKLGSYPLLLLDDIASELDNSNTKRIFNMKTLEKQQTFITIINYKDLPKEVLEHAQLIDLNSLK